MKFEIHSFEEVIMKFNVRGLAKLQARITGTTSAIGPAISQSINEVAEQQVATTVENVENMIALDNIKFLQAFKIDPATKQRTKCTIKIDARFAVRLSAFEARQTPAGVEVKILRFGQWILYRRTFGPERPRLMNGIYYRLTKQRFPIKMVKALEVAKVPEIRNKIQETMSDKKDDYVLAVRDRLGKIVIGEQM